MPPAPATPQSLPSDQPVFIAFKGNDGQWHATYHIARRGPAGRYFTSCGMVIDEKPGWPAAAQMKEPVKLPVCPVCLGRKTQFAKKWFEGRVIKLKRAGKVVKEMRPPDDYLVASDDGLGLFGKGKV